ncbi:MAG TPA: tRNA (guanosine(46)-N7)-methyltransferase TrmB [Clostridiaceae bacterium]
MRLRKKQWARPYIEKNPFAILKPFEYKGKWGGVFGNDNPIHLELGVGRGGHFYERALNNKDINYIGIELKDEVLIDGLVSITEGALTNGRLIPLNIMNMEGIFDKGEIERIYINFCNPWPKIRHQKRRLTHPRFLKLYKDILKEDGEIWFKTDDIALFEDSILYFKESDFNLTYISYDLHNSDFDDNIVTEYEEKFMGLGFKIMFLKAVLNY